METRQENSLTGETEQPATGSGNLPIQICNLCKKELELVEGDTVCGNQWYHKDCWKRMNEVNQKVNLNQDDTKKILIIGLGQIGYSNAEYMTSLGLKVDGYDISEKAIQRA